MNYTDDQLKQLLAKMLPETVDWREIKNCSVGTSGSYFVLCWKRRACVFDTELLHLCSLVEDGLTAVESCAYFDMLRGIEPDNEAAGAFAYHATWQQRTTALAQVKGATR